MSEVNEERARKKKLRHLASFLQLFTGKWTQELTSQESLIVALLWLCTKN